MPRGGARPNSGPKNGKRAATLVKEAARAEALAQTGVTAAKVIEEMRRLAFSDVRGLFDERGNLRPIHTLSDEQAAALASIEVIIKNAAAGDGHTDTIHKVRVWDKCKSLEMLGKHLGLFEADARIHGTIQLVWGS